MHSDKIPGERGEQPRRQVQQLNTLFASFNLFSFETERKERKKETCGENLALGSTHRSLESKWRGWVTFRRSQMVVLFYKLGLRDQEVSAKIITHTGSKRPEVVFTKVLTIIL
jgi:hypothetical protein